MDYTATTGSRGPTAPALGPVTKLSPGVSPVGLPAPQPSPGNVILASFLGPQTTTTGPGRGHTSGGQIEHSPAPLATHGLSGRRRLQSHTGLSVPLLQSPRTPVVVSPSPAMRRLFRVRDPVSPGHRATATEGPGLAEWRREGGACQMALACYAGPQGAIAWACVAAFYLARLRVGQTRGP